MSDLVVQVALRNLEIAARGITGHLEPVTKQVEVLAHFLEDESYSLETKPRLADLLMGSATSLPQIESILVLGSDGRAARLRRGADYGQYEVTFPNLGKVRAFKAALTEMEKRDAGYWGHQFQSSQNEATFVTYRRPLRKNGRFFGMIGAAVSIKGLSTLTMESGGTFGNTTFVMHGEDDVIAHPRLTESFPRDGSSPAVSVARLGDNVIAALDKAVLSKFSKIPAAENTQVFELTAGDVPYLLFRKTLHGFGDPPFVIGFYQPAREVNAPLNPLYSSGLIGLGILLFALTSTAFLSRAIARPIRRMTDSVTKVGRFSPSQVRPAPETWIREVSDLARSFNGMLNGLRYFETYVPQKLVQQLIKQEGGPEVVSEERELTVMFTDIADFTGLCENMTAQEVANFLNEHFTLLAKYVEDEGGTIDKFIGDAMMVFWGAPEPLENSAEKACRAAQKIATAVTKKNELRRSNDEAIVRIRLGVHTGPLVVGNIGSPSRINYTVVGDTVNATQRLESLGKEIAPNDVATILISDATARSLPAEFRTKPVGSFEVKGRSETITVHRLMV